MRDLFSQCTCICTYVHVGHTRNVNLYSRSGKLSDTCITRRCRDAFLGDGGQRSWPFVTYVFGEPSA